MACKYNDSVTCNRKIWKCEECSIEKCVKAVKDKVVEMIDDEAELAYADFEIYAQEHGYDAEYEDDFRYGMRRAIDIVKKGGVNEIDRCRCFD